VATTLPWRLVIVFCRTTCNSRWKTDFYLNRQTTSLVAQLLGSFDNRAGPTRLTSHPVCIILSPPPTMLTKPTLAFLLYTLLSKARLVVSLQSSPESLAAQYSLTTSTSLPFPSATQASSGAQAAIASEWSLSEGAVQSGGRNISFVNDPFPNPCASDSSDSTGPILQVTYPAGSFSHGTGGSNLYKPWSTSDGSTFQSMMLSYEVAFDAGFDWVKGGKLPGLRGGPDSQGCSGGRETDGKTCFSTRLMWRKDGAGEGAYITNSIIYSFYEPCPVSVYAYIPNTSGLCSEKDTICDPQYGTSISRGAFNFTSGQ